MSSLDYLDLCRLCLVKDRVSVPIFEGEGDVRQIFLKIAACLPVKVGREDKLPKKICDDCVYKVELFYQFWNTTANAEKQLLQWLGDVSLDDKQGYVTGAHPSLMKPGQNPGENRLDGSVMQQVNDHPNNMGMGMLDGMGMGMPMMISTSGQQQQSQQQMTSVPMDTGGNSVQTVQAVPGPSTQSSHDQIVQRKTNASTNQEDDEDESEEDENSDDECDGDDGLPVKEESEEDPTNGRTIEPTTFVNVSLACDEAGPSGLQQQKIGEMPEMVMPPTDGDPKSGYIPPDPLGPDFLTVKIMDDFFRIPKSLCYFMVSQPTHGEKANAEHMTKEQEKNEKRKYTKDLPSTTNETSKPTQQVKLECPSNVEVTADESATKTKTSRKRTDKKPKKPKKVTNKSFSPTIEKTETEGTIECSSREELAENEPPKKKMKKNDEKKEKVTKNVSLTKIANSNNSVKESVENPSQEEVTANKLPKKRKKREKVTKKVRTKKSKKSTEGSKKCPSDEKNLGDLVNRRQKNAKKIKKVNEIQISFECETCARSFPRKSQLRVHMVNHSTVRSHKCNVCQKAFKRKSELTSHMELHSGIKFTCDECNFVTSSKISVRFHLRRTHQKDYRYKCDECGKNFMSNCQLKDHKSSHLGVKTFICEVCGRSYFQKSHLASHRRTVHGIVQRAMRKDYECKICKKHFASEYILQNHGGIHSRKFLCTYCGKEFASNSGLQLHTRMHTGERPYQCRFCPKSFVRTNALTVHELTHSGMRPYVCDLCGKSFTQRTTMMGHRKKHPGKHPPPPPTMLSKLKPTGDTNS